jgi:hypothetical protein
VEGTGPRCCSVAKFAISRVDTSGPVTTAIVKLVSLRRHTRPSSCHHKINIPNVHCLSSTVTRF